MSEQLTFFQPDTKRFTTIQEQFGEFHRLNPSIYNRLVSESRKLLGRGHKKIGMKMLFEVLRWLHYTQTEDPSSDFKLNNNYHSRYARLIMDCEPDLKGVFELRELKSP